MMLEDRQRTYEEFIGLEYDYTFRETRARYGYTLHGQHGDDEPIDVLRVPSAESGGSARIVNRKVEINEYIGYEIGMKVGDTGEYSANKDANMGIILKKVLIECLRTPGNPRAGREEENAAEREPASPADAAGAEIGDSFGEKATASDAAYSP